MTTPLQPGQLRIHDRFEPELQPGTYDLLVGQTVTSASATLAAIATSTVKLEVVDPAAAALPATEVLAVYPPAGAEDAVDVMLPHVVLRTRTLPWAHAPVAGLGSPWLALLLFAKDAGEVEFVLDSAKREHARVACSRLQKLMPRRTELARLCHVRELPSDDPLAARDDDRFVAIVIGNRLPSAGQGDTKAAHIACLVDLRGADKASIWPDSPAAAGTHDLRVLHRWAFQVSSGGDFEAYFARLREPAKHGTGGVVALGQSTAGQPIANDDGELDLAAPRPDAPARTVRYAGPCVPLPRGLVDAPADDKDALLGVAEDGSEVVTYSAAFELGRLLALGNPRVLDALLRFRDEQFRRDVEVVIHTALPGVPKPPGPSCHDSWKDIFDDTDGWMPGTLDALWQHTADPTGILPLVGQLPGLGFDQLASLGSTRFARRLSDIGASASGSGPAAPTTITPDLHGVEISLPSVGPILHQRFAELAASVAHIDIDTAKKDFER